MVYTTEFDILNAVATAGNDTDTLNVNVSSSGLPLGAATSANQTNGSQITGIVAGTAKIGQVAIDQTTPGTTNLVQIGGSLPAFASTPTVTANQGGAPWSTNQLDTKNLSQNVTASSQNVVVSTVNQGSVIVQVTGTFSGTLNFQATVDGTNWFSWFGYPNSTGLGTVSSITSPDQVLFSSAGIQQFRVLSSGWVSGTAVVSLVASQASSGLVQYVGANSLSGFNTIPVNLIGNSNSVNATVQSSASSIVTVNILNKDINNSSTANLASGASFTGSGTIITTNGVETINVTLFADQNCTVQVLQSTDSPGVNFDITDSWTTTASTTDSRSIKITGQTYKVKVTNNGGSTTTSLRLLTVEDSSPVTLPRALTQAGNLKTAVSEALPAGTNVIGHVINDASSAVIGHVIVDTAPSTAVTNVGTFAVQAALNAETTKVIGTVNIAASQVVGLSTGANTIGALTANQSVNNSQINGVTPLMGNGTTGTGSQRVTIASDNTAFSVNATPPTLTKGTQGATGYSVQLLQDAGRVHINYYASGVASGTTGSETAISLTQSSGTSATSSAVSWAVTNGKTYRISSIIFGTRGNATGTAEVTTFSLRINTGGSVTTSTTPITLSARSGAAATALAYDRIAIPIEAGYEIVGTATLQFGVTANSVFTTNAPTWDVLIMGYEY